MMSACFGTFADQGAAHSQMALQELFLVGLTRIYHPLINLGNLHACQSPAQRSHTLVSHVRTLQKSAQVEYFPGAETSAQRQGLCTLCLAALNPA